MKKNPGPIRAALWRILGIDSSLLAAGVSHPTETEAGQTITPETVLSHSTAWACISLIAQSIATLPLKLFVKTNDGREEANNHPLYRALGMKPNTRMTSVEFWSVMILSMLLWGNGYAQIVRLGKRVVGLNFLPPNRVSLKLKNDGRSLQYIYSHRGGTTIFEEDDILHIPALSMDGRIGITPISAGAKVFGSALAANEASASTFKNGLHPTVAFKYPTTLKDIQRKEMRETITALSGAARAGKPVILEAGMEADELGINPKDAQLLESRAFSVEEICRWFGVPPFMVGHQEKSTSWGAGLEATMIGFVRFTLRPWIIRIEQAINKALLDPSEQGRYYAEFVLEALLRGDSAARREFYASALQNAYMNRDEVRSRENLPPIPDGSGQMFTVQSNLVPLGELGQNDGNESNRARNAMRNWLGFEEEVKDDASE